MANLGIPCDSVLTRGHDTIPGERLVDLLYLHLQGLTPHVCLEWRWHIKPKLSASALKHENFCLALLSGITAADAARKAGYGRKNINVRIVAWELLQREDIQKRLTELSEATADEAIMSVIERKRRLSQIARARYDDPDREGDPITAIHQLNLMDGVYRNKTKAVALGGSTTVVVVKNASTKLATTGGG